MNIEFMCELLANYSKELSKAETYREKGEVQLKHAKLILDKVKNCSIPDVVGQREQLKAEDKDLSFADYLEKWYKLPRYEKVYDRKDGKGTDTEDEVIKNYRRAFRL